MSDIHDIINTIDIIDIVDIVDGVNFDGQKSSQNSNKNSADVHYITQDKLTSEQWKAIEQTFSETDKKVCTEMMALPYATANSGLNPKLNTDNNTSKLKVCAELAYCLIIRPELVKLNILPPLPKDKDVAKEEETNAKTKKKHIKKGKMEQIKQLTKRDQIIFDNSTLRLKETLNQLLPTFVPTVLNKKYGFSSVYIIELRVATLMYCANYTLGNNSKKKRASEANGYDLIIGIKKMINMLDTEIFDCMIDNSKQEISKTAIADLKIKLTQLVKEYNFTSKTLVTKYPWLSQMTSYDDVMPCFSIKPHKNQIELFNIVKDSVSNNEAAFILYKAMIGGGKTTASLPIASYIMQLKEQKKANGKIESLQLIFCCSVEPVRHQVGRLAYNAHVPFGVANMRKGKPFVTKHYSCKKDENVVLIIADLETSIALLNESQNYILFLDEPTVRADVTSSSVTYSVAELWNNAPSIIINSSATMPELEEIKQITDHFKKRHISAKLHVVRSYESTIGCELIASNGESISPHSGCVNATELGVVIERINADPFLGRLYTAPVVFEIHKKMSNLGVHDLPDVEAIFSNVKNLSQKNIRILAMELLTLLKTQPNQIITQICSHGSNITISKNINYNNGTSENDDDNDNDNEKEKEKEKEIAIDPDDDDDIFGWEKTEIPNSDTKVNDEAANPLKYGTEHAYRYLGGTLITTKDPVAFVVQNFKPLISDIESASILIGKYKKKLEENERGRENLRRQILDEDKLYQELQDFDEENRAEIQFPSHKQINTVHHIHNYAKHAEKVINKKLIRLPLSIGIPFTIRTAIAGKKSDGDDFKLKHNIKTVRVEENVNNIDVDIDLDIPDDVKLFLMAGIGIYCPSSPVLNWKYTQSVLQLAAAGKLAYLVSDDSICYGANYPLNRVIVCDDVVEIHSIGTIFQLLGRMGRAHVSWMAFGYIEQKTLQRIMDYVHNMSSEISHEAKNLIDAFNQVLDDKKLQAELEKSKENEKIAQSSSSVVKKNSTVSIIGFVDSSKDQINEYFHNQNIIKLSQVKTKDEELSFDDIDNYNPNNNNNNNKNEHEDTNWRKVERTDRRDRNNYDQDRHGDNRNGNRNGDNRNGDNRYGDNRYGDNRNGDNRNGDNRNGDNRNGDNRNGDNRNGDNRYGDNRNGDSRQLSNTNTKITHFYQSIQISESVHSDESINEISTSVTVDSWRKRTNGETTKIIATEKEIIIKKNVPSKYVAPHLRK
jgi:hypothetical protein